MIYLSVILAILTYVLTKSIHFFYSHIHPLTNYFFFFLKDTAPTEIYPLPLHDALPISRVVARSRHEQQADVIGLGLLRPAVGEQHADLGAEPVGGEDGLRARPATEQCAEDRPPRLRGHRLAHSLGAVSRDRVRDLVAEDHGQAVGVDGDGKDARVHGHLSARERKGVLLLRIVDDREAPLVARLVRRRGQSSAGGFHGRNDRGARIQPALGEHLL